MFELPPIPTWAGLHPLIIHFPIGLLLVAPIFIVLGLFMRNYVKCFSITSFLLLLLGTIAVYIAVGSGEEAGELATRSQQMASILEQHEELAETTRIIFSVLTVVYAAMIFLPMILKKEVKYSISMGMRIVFLVLYGIGIVILVNTAHHGGLLVHKFGIHSLL